MMFEPQKEHRWLQRLVGRWTYESECVMGPDQPPMKNAGTLTGRMLGEAWWLGEGTDSAHPMTSILTLGFDPARKRFVGTFIASPMASLWVYDGSMDAGDRVITLDTEGPNMLAPGTTAKYQDILESKGDDEWTLSSQCQTPDGKWIPFMSMTYRRAV